MSFDVDDDDREHFYRQYGRPKATTRLARLRRSRALLSLVLVIAVLYIFVSLSGRQKEHRIDWSRNAYILYATDTHSLCNAYMVFDALKKHGSKAERVLQYPLQWDTHIESKWDRESQLLVGMQKYYGVKLLPIELQGIGGDTSPGSLDQEAHWDTSLTKLTAFQLTSFDRVLHLDADITLFQNLDELFLLPPTPIAMPRAYWADVPPPSREEAQPFPLTAMLILLQPNQKHFRSMMNTMQAWRHHPDFETNKKYDMDLLNHQFGSSAMVLPQRPYALLSSEFRSEDHSRYLGELDGTQRWDAEEILKEAKLIHFSDWPLPKPWILSPTEGIAELQPKCVETGGLECPDRRIWKGLYDDFRKRRRDLCGILSVPAPQWTKWKHDHGAGNMTFR